MEIVIAFFSDVCITSSCHLELKLIMLFSRSVLDIYIYFFFKGILNEATGGRHELQQVEHLARMVPAFHLGHLALPLLRCCLVSLV